MRSPRKPLAYFLMVATGVFLSTMDSSMINIALPYIMSSFNTTLAQVEWVVLIYLLTISISLLIWGKLSDRIGKGVIYLLGMLVFSMSSLSCYFSQNLLMLVLSRFVQGVGASMMMSTGPAIIRLSVPHSQLGKWLGSLGIATSMGLMSGPLFGGFILHTFSWRTIFILNVPISFSVFLFGWIFLAGTLPKYIHEQSKFDWIGSMFWGAVVTFTVLLLNGQGITNIYWFVLSSFGLVFLTLAFFRYEREHNDPLIPVTLLKERYYIIAMVTVAISFAVLFFALILMPFFLKYITQLTFDKIGYMMMAVPVTLFVVSPLSGRLFDRIGAKYLTFFGLSIIGIAVLFLSVISENTSLANIAWRLSLLGCGQSIFLSPNSASVLSKVSFKDTGISSGMLATSRNIGMLAGVAMVGLVFSYFFGEFTGGGNLREYSHEHLPQFLRSFRYTLSFAAALAFFGAFISLQRES